MKKSFYLLVLSLMTIPIKLFAYTNNQIVNFDGITYKVISATDFTLCFLGTEKSGELVIPDSVSDGVDTKFTVIETGGDGYKSSNVTSVVLPNTIKTIGYASFNGASLESINIPASVETISHNAGYNWYKTPKVTVEEGNANFCNDEDGSLYSKDMKDLYLVPSSCALDNGTYTVKESVEQLFFNAFSHHNSLTKIVLPKNLKKVETGYPTITHGLRNFTDFEIASGGDTPYYVEDGVLCKDSAGTKTLVDYPQARRGAYKVPDGITVLEEEAFMNVNQMTSIDLNEVEKMNKASIHNCGALKTVTFPKNLKTEDIDGAIASCANIEQYIVPDDCVNFTGIDGVVFSKDTTTLYFYPPQKAGATYDIPASVETIARYAFRVSANIETLTIPATVKNIGSQAFRDMKKLATVTFEEPSTIEKFSSNIFMDCSLLTEVTLPTSLKEIEDAFYRCTALETINVPDGSQLQEIKGSAFITNTALKSFNFQGSSELKVIGTNAFANLPNLQSFNFPKTVTTISANAFSGCSNMATATFAEDAVITSIGSGAFADCGLTSITIPESVVRIENEAFRNCKVLYTVNLSSSVNNISSEAFKNCENLTDINVNKDNTVYSSVDGYLLSADKETLILFPPGKANSKFTLLPPSITKIGDFSFYNCSKLENVVIPNKVNSIGKRAFGLCTNLNTITFLCDEVISPDSINREPNNMSFDDGSNVADDMFKNIDIYVRKELQKDFKALEFYQNFRIVGTSFYDNDVEYLPVSNNSVSIMDVQNKDYTFVPTEATNPDGGKTYNIAMIGDYAFQNAGSDIHEVVVKNNVEYIGGKAFMTNITNNTSTIENVFFIQSAPTARMLSTTRFELDETGNNYNEFASTTHVYVKKSALNDYKTAWTKTVYDRATKTFAASPYDFTSQLDFRIPGVDIKTKYATFAREFDTDFSDYYATNGNSRVAAFTAGSDITEGPGDYGTSEYHVRMTSIDETGGYSGSFAYVPAYTGVLLKVIDRASTNSGFYYTIGEHDDQAYTITDNIMTGITVNYADVEASAADPVYVMQGGVFTRATSLIPNFPIHKAYMKTGALPGGAKQLKLDFADDDSSMATGITNASAETTGREVYYNLNGQRVERPLKGIHIRQGKKVIVK